MRLAVGLALTALGMLLVLQSLGGEANSGGVVLIGPIPIVFGSSPGMATIRPSAGAGGHAAPGLGEEMSMTEMSTTLILGLALTLLGLAIVLREVLCSWDGQGISAGERGEGEEGAVSRRAKRTESQACGHAVSRPRAQGQKGEEW